MNKPKSTNILFQRLGDLIFISLAFALIVSSYFFFWSTNKHQGQTADISVNQQNVLTVSLYQNKTYKIKGHIGHSTIKVEQGKIRFIHSPCTKKYCVLQGWRQLEGDAAACLPNRVVISINGAPNGFDVLNY